LKLAMSGAESLERVVEPPLPAGLKSRFFGDYEILEEIARGGMGVVYRARQLSLNREVALKMIQAGHLLSTEARLRFRVEIEAVAQLNHPNIVSLHESDEHEGVHYFTMRLVEGGNLSERLEKHRDIRDNVALLVKVCRTVHYAHQRGILHRDLKPSNILIDPRGEPHVADFGLARSLEQETGFTYSSSILGSPNYMAPEQASSQSGPVSTAADVYGLGAILYQMLTGRPPFQGRTALETIRQVVDTVPAAPRRLNPQVDADLATICLKCLEKKPTDRYESAEELARDLDSWLHGRPIRARPVGAIGTAWRWARRHPAVSSLSVALGLALVGVTVGASIAAVRIREAQRDAVSHLRLSLLDQARLLKHSRQTAVRVESMRLIRKAVSLGDRADIEERARDELLAALAFTDLEFSPQTTLPVSDPELSLVDPRFERVAFIADRTNLVVRELQGGKETRRLGAGSSTIVRVESFSPEGRYLAVRHVDGLSFWDLEGGQIRLAFATNGPQRVFAFATHANQLFLEEGHQAIHILELPSFRSVRRMQMSVEDPGGGLAGWRIFSVSPDGSMLVGYREPEKALELIEVRTGRRRWRKRMESPVTALIWQPMYRRVMAASADGAAQFRRWDDGEPGGRLRLPGPVRSLALNDSNTLLASAGKDRIVRLWDLISYRQIFHSQGDAHQLWFDETGGRLGSVQRGEVAGWMDLSRSLEFQEMVIGSGVEVVGCEFSGDGRMVAGGFSGQIDVRRVSDGRSVGEINRVRLPIFSFDPLGHGLATSDATGVTFRPLTEEEPGRFRVDSPRTVVEGPRWRAMAYSPDGQRFLAANAMSNMVYVFDRSLTNCLLALGPHQGVDMVSSDREARLVATANSGRREVRVWDAATRSVVHTGALGRQSRMALSPDGRWLLVHGDRFELFDLSTKKPAPALPFGSDMPMTDAACFSSDGRVLAVVVDQYEVQLFDLSRWRSLGRLRTPRESRMISLAFSRDGARLAAGTTQGRLRLWNLSQIRRQLAEAGLDWEQAPFPMAPASITPEPPVELIGNF
jgi:WD40 repeat protein